VTAATVRKDRKRYEQVADWLIDGIRSERHAVGETLPGEIELATHFSVSRHTVREALRRVEELGLIGRHPGVGTVVLARYPTQTHVQLVRSPAELLQYPAGSRLVPLSAEPIRVGRRLSQTLGCPSGSDWQRVSCIRRLKGSRLPISWVDVYLLPAHTEVAARIGRRAKPVYEMIDQIYGVKAACVDVEIRAGCVPTHMLDTLEVPAGAPSLTVIRRYKTAEGRLFEVSVSEHPAERYTYSLQLKRGWQSGDGGWSSISEQGQ